MPLSEFIRANMDQIVSEWETFARSLVPGDSMDIRELRDHAKQMLIVVARDLDTPQTKREESSKAKGESDAGDTTVPSPAQAHGAGRAESGFDVGEMVSEYRALRASVVRLWAMSEGGLAGRDVDDLIRFNEAIDQALAESTSRFSAELDRTREMFLGILGHDLRTPLSAMVTSAQFILEVSDRETTAKMAEVIVRSGVRMDHMVDDLLEFTRGRLGSSIPAERAPMDLGTGLAAAVEEIRASRPGTEVELEASGALSGSWDERRLGQVWSNLLSNAVDHGSPGTPIRVDAKGEDGEVVVSVHNRGDAIPKVELSQIFNPLVTNNKNRDSAHLGLGLYIAEKIVQAHGGTIEVESSDERGTTFTVRLPRSS